VDLSGNAGCVTAFEDEVTSPVTFLLTMTNPSEPNPELQKRNATLVLILVGIIALGAVVAFNYSVVLKRQQAEEAQRPKFEHRIEQDMDFLNEEGEPFGLANMRGKVYLISYVFTQCPSQCAGVIESVKEIAAEFPNEERLEFVAVSLEPDVDRPEVLKEWAKLHDVDNAKWHFLTTPEVGETKGLHDFMTEGLMFYRVNKIDGPEKYEHDPRVALVDGSGNIRGFFDLLDLQAPELERASLKTQINQLLDEKPQRGPWLIWLVVIFGGVFLLFGLIVVNGANKRRSAGVE